MTDTAPELDMNLEAYSVREAQARAGDEARRLGLASAQHADAVARHLADVRRELGLEVSVPGNDPIPW
jgi:hypothetical protein